MAKHWLQQTTLTPMAGALVGSAIAANYKNGAIAEIMAAEDVRW